jgi:hypothetical protein
MSGLQMLRDVSIAEIHWPYLDEKHGRCTV